MARVLMCMALVAVLAGSVGVDRSEPAAAATAATATTQTAAQPSPRSSSDLGPDFTLPSWGDASNWSDASSYSTIQFTDLPGAGPGVLLGRSAVGLETWQFTTYPDLFDVYKGYWLPLGADTSFSNDAGWDEPQYYSTIQTADIDGNGTKELLSRASDGLATHVWTPEGNAWVPVDTDDDFSDDAGWDDPQYYETIQTTDSATSGAPALLIGRGAGGIATYEWNTSTTSWDVVSWDSPAWSDAAGWDAESSYSTIQTADLTGDGSAELIGRGPGGLEVYGWDGGTKTWNFLVSDEGYSNAAGWDDHEYYSTIQTGDIEGIGSDYLLARAAEGLLAQRWDAGSGGLETLGYDPDFSDANGWDDPQYYETIQTADIEGDGTDWLISRGADGILTDAFDSEANAWARAATNVPALSDAAGWDEADRYLTVLTSPIGNSDNYGLVARDGVGMRTWFFTGTTWDRADEVPFPAFSGAEERGYQAVNAHLGIADLRSTYDTTDTGDLNLYLTLLESMSSPNAANITRAQWTALKGQLTNEITWAIRTIDHYQTMVSVLDHATMADDLGLSAIVDAIDANSSSSHVIDVVVGTMAAAITDAVVEAALTTAGGPVGALAGGVVATAWSLSVDEMFASDVSGTITHLESTLGNDFEDALTGLQDALSAMTTNYGLLLPVGTVLDAAPISTQQQQAMRSAHLREWTTFAYRTAAQAEREGHAPTFGIAGCGDSSAYANSCSDYQWSTPSEEWYLVDDGGVLWVIQFKTFGADNLSDGLYETIFGEVSSSCLSDFTSDCNLGIDKETVMFDWPLPECWTPARTGCPAF